MEFDCEGVRRLLGKVRAGGGPGGSQRSGPRALPLRGPLPLPYPFFPKLFCCLDASTHTVVSAGLEVATILLPQPPGAGVTGWRRVTFCMWLYLL